jgi:hypothetical protein
MQKTNNYGAFIMCKAVPKCFNSDNEISTVIIPRETFMLLLSSVRQVLLFALFTLEQTEFGSMKYFAWGYTGSGRSGGASGSRRALSFSSVLSLSLSPVLACSGALSEFCCLSLSLFMEVSVCVGYLAFTFFSV